MGWAIIQLHLRTTLCLSRDTDAHPGGRDLTWLRVLHQDSLVLGPEALVCSPGDKARQDGSPSREGCSMICGFPRGVFLSFESSPFLDGIMTLLPVFPNLVLGAVDLQG